MPAEAPTIADAAQSAAALGGNAGSNPISTGKNLESAFGQLDKMVKPPSIETAPIPASPAQKSMDAAREANKPKPPGPPKKPEEAKQPDDDTTETPKQQDQTQQQQPPKQKKPADFLREKLSKTEQERDTFRTELEKLKTAPKEHPELKSLSEQIEALRKEKTQLEEEFRYVKYEKSPEYKQKYQQPFEESWNRGRQMMARLKFVDAEGNTRNATAQDFDGIMQAYLNDPETAAAQLDTMFGPRASLITPHLLEVEKAGQAMNHAVEEYRKSGAEREKQWQQAHERVTKEISEHWQAAIKPESVPDQWKPFVLPKGADKDGNLIDEDGDKLIQKGLAEYDRIASENPSDPSLSKEKRAEILGRIAAVRNKAAAFNRLVRDNRKLQAEFNALQKKLEQYQKSEPGNGDGKGERTETPPANSMEAAMQFLDKRAQPKFY